MTSSQGPAQRVFGAGKRLLGSLLDAGETRLRLAVLELEEERARLATLLLVIGLSLVMLLLGLAVLALLVAVLFWDTHRVAAIAISAGVLLTGGVLMALLARRMAHRPTLLKSTLTQLAIDRELVAKQEARERARDESRS
ncbi:hypothetical protein HOP52_05875 [Halomonas campisalis]|uniref:Phage holin family protein n=1 Tax=Billgrantia campisalis TaxID=74661 RepID=A0ABS9P892_9GAMM|nr:phage holin family protein [Halomonas campisalis]MCG6657300.1 hypothetical protein [Halomonas campisalis]MDR5864158.1 phage holin family protein [Halomonas campisalis]